MGLLCHASFAAKILLKDGDSFPVGDVIGIQDKTVVVKTQFGNLTADFAKIDTILFNESADPTKPGIQLQNGDFITGTIDSLKEGTLTINTKYGVCIIKNLEMISSINFLKNPDEFDYTQNNKSETTFHLNTDERIYGQLLAIEDKLLVVNSKYGTLKIENSEVQQVQFAEAKKVSNTKEPMILLKNQNRVHGKVESFKNGELHIHMDYGEMVITNMNVIANIVFGGGAKKTTGTIDDISSYTVRMYNVDDLATLYINDKPVYKSKWGYSGVEGSWDDHGHKAGDSKEINITQLLQEGENVLKFTLWNDACCGVSLSIEVKEDGKIIFSDTFGNQDSGSGIKYDKSFTITIP